MKTRITKLSVLLLITVYCSLFTAYAQIPQAFNYQAVARDGSGNILAGQIVGLRLSILQGSGSGTLIYSERQVVSTNQFGLFTLSLGTGSVITGTFSTIDWSAGNYWLRTEMDPNGGTTYTNMGNAELLTVPYAMYAAK
ncbi:MAG: hypothetical protein ABR968_00835, partial [Bacteroidales bacterium]